MKRILMASTIALAMAAIVHAQATVTGRWRGETRSGSQIVLDLEVKEKTLSGTLTRNGEVSKIADGQVSKNVLTFTATLGDQVESLTGECTGDQISIWLNRQGPERAIVLKRLKH